MGTYYEWANMTKRQRIENSVFDNGLKLLESCWYECPATNALCTLLATEWHGDVVAFLPDEGWSWDRVPEGDTRFDAVSYLPGYEPVGYAEDWFEDITGIFKVAEGKEGWVMEPQGPDGHFHEFAYTGPFDRDIIQYRYVINETKKVFYDRFEQTKDGEIDPLPILLALSLDYLYIGSRPADADGSWIGDVITPSHEPPADSDYSDITGLYSY